MDVSRQFSNLHTNQIIYLIIFLLGLSPLLVNAQYFDAGQEPASIRWMQIKSPHFTTLFSKGYQQEAMRATNYLEQVSAHHVQNGRPLPQRISLILHNRNVTANGFVALAPWRMEWFSIPAQDNYRQDWFAQLAQHEYQHVLQLHRMKQGAVRPLYWLFGEQATAFFTGMHLPFWFIEGQAVTMETALSSSGRGRVAHFTTPLRCQIREKETYSYDKAVFGSFRDFVPNRYQLGYPLVASGRQQYGNEVWDQVMETVTHNPLWIGRFSRGIKNATGHKLDTYYKKSLQDWASRHLNSSSKAPLKADTISPTHRVYTHYRHPVQTADGRIFALRNSLQEVTQIVEITPTGKITTVETPGALLSKNFSVNNNKMAWDAWVPNPRWGQKNHAQIHLFHPENKKTERIKLSKTIFSPAISPITGSIAAVEINQENQNFLVVLDQKGRDVIHWKPMPKGSMIYTPAWSEDEKQLAYIALTKKGKSLIVYHLPTHQTDTLIAPVNTELAFPTFGEKHIFFTAQQNDTENIFAVNRSNGKVYQITNCPYGATDPALSPYQQTLLYSAYTANGYQIQQIPLRKENWQSVVLQAEENALAAQLTQQENGPLPMDDTLINYEVKPYKKWKHLFHPHSWAPISILVDEERLEPGFSIQSQNLLSTTFISGGYRFRPEEKTGQFYVNATYKGWYPVFSLEYRNGKRGFSGQNELGQNKDYNWEERETSLRIEIPLQFTKKQYRMRLLPALENTISQSTKTAHSPSTLFEGQLHTTDASLYFSRLHSMAQRDLLPKWGQIIETGIRNTPFGDINFGYQYRLESWLLFPGLLKNHGFMLYAGGQINDYNRVRYRFSNQINWPRGHTVLAHKQMFTFMADYLFPLAYPDWSIRKILYLKRVRMRLFSDFSQIDQLFRDAANQITTQASDLWSIGLQLNADLHLFRIPVPMDFGIRPIYLPQENETRLDFTFRINISAF